MGEGVLPLEVDGKCKKKFWKQGNSEATTQKELLEGCRAKKFIHLAPKKFSSSGSKEICRALGQCGI